MGRDKRKRGWRVEVESFYLFVSSLEYHGEGTMTDQVLGVIFEIAYNFHCVFYFVNRSIESSRAVELHQRWHNVELLKERMQEPFN